MRSYTSVLMILLVGCATGSNDSVATYVPVGDTYRVTLTGKRVNMSHDIFSALFSSTSPTSDVLILPRINGRVEGHEIPVEKGNYAYLGKVEVTGQTMKVDLFYNNTDLKSKDASSWNGSYHLRPANN